MVVLFVKVDKRAVPVRLVVAVLLFDVCILGNVHLFYVRLSSGRLHVLGKVSCLARVTAAAAAVRGCRGDFFVLALAGAACGRGRIE